VEIGEGYLEFEGETRVRSIPKAVGNCEKPKEVGLGRRKASAREKRKKGLSPKVRLGEGKLAGEPIIQGKGKKNEDTGGR